MRYKVGKERDSSIELLRIIAMLMIVLHHLCLYGYAQLGFAAEIGAVDLARNIMLLWGEVGVDSFVLISGFFLASGRIKTTSLLRVLLEAWFYAFVLGLACAAFFPTTFDVKVFIKSFFPTDGGLPWFVTAYLGMYLVAPWLSRLAADLENSSFRQMILVGFVIFSVLPTLPGCKFVISNFVWFCYLFLIACYIRRFGVGESLAKRLLIGGGCFLVLSVVFIEVLAIWLPVLHGRETYFCPMYTVPILATSVGLFCTFKDLRIGHIKWVNLIAQGVFGVYLIHENKFVRPLLWSQFGFVFNSSETLVVPLALLSVVLVFGVLVCLDLARLYLLEKHLFTFLDRKCGKLFENCDRVLNGLGPRPMGD